MHRNKNALLLFCSCENYKGWFRYVITKNIDYCINNNMKNIKIGGDI